MGSIYRENHKRAARKNIISATDPHDLLRIEDAVNIETNASGIGGYPFVGPLASGDILIFNGDSWDYTSRTEVANINAEDDGTPIGGSPFDTLNFIGEGVSLANGGVSASGGNLLNVTIPGGLTNFSMTSFSWNSTFGTRTTGALAFEPKIAFAYGALYDTVDASADQPCVSFGITMGTGGNTETKSVVWTNDNNGDANRDSVGFSTNGEIGAYLYQRAIVSGVPGGFKTGYADGIPITVDTFSQGAGVSFNIASPNQITGTLHVLVVG